MTNWQPNNNYVPMARQSEIETDEGTSKVMVPVGKYDIDKGIKSFDTAVEYEDSEEEELYYLGDDGEYYKV